MDYCCLHAQVQAWTHVHDNIIALSNATPEGKRHKKRLECIDYT